MRSTLRFRSLLLDRVDISIPGLRVSTFAVHRHLPELTEVDYHRHPHAQALLYLEGHGQQLMEGAKAAVEPGTLVLIPPKVSHAFARQSARTPCCAMIDFRLSSPGAAGLRITNLNRSELAQISQSITKLIQTAEDHAPNQHLDHALSILNILHLLLRAGDWLPRIRSTAAGSTSSSLAGIFKTVTPTSPLQAAIARSGYQRDHLNRLLKKETGLTLGQLRAQRRLSAAKEMLLKGTKVCDVADAVGFLDPNYFARWFKRQTGQSPTTWTAHQQYGRRLKDT